MRYLDGAWVAEARRRIAALPPERLGRTTTSLCNVHEGGEGRVRHLLVRFDRGRLVELTVGDGEPADGAEFVLRGDHATFARLCRAELSPLQALLGGAVRLDGGSRLRALRLAPLAQRVTAALATIPTDATPG